MHHKIRRNSKIASRRGINLAVRPTTKRTVAGWLLKPERNWGKKENKECGVTRGVSKLAPRKEHRPCGEAHEP